MKTDRQRVSATEMSLAHWVEREVFSSRKQPVATKSSSSDNVILVPGQYLSAVPSDQTVVVVTMQPSVIERKLAIREINARMAGKMPISNTLPRD